MGLVTLGKDMNTHCYGLGRPLLDIVPVYRYSFVSLFIGVFACFIGVNMNKSAERAHLKNVRRNNKQQ
jgi:hypothetical protein